MSPEDRIVVTGTGLWTPLGATRESSWQALIHGRRAGRWLTPDDLRLPRGLDPQSFERLPGAPAFHRPGTSVASTMMLQAAQEALQHAGLQAEELSPLRWGCVIGASKGSFEAFCPVTDRGGLNDGYAAAPDRPLLAVRAALKHQGPATCPVAACATGAMAVFQGAQWIREGRCDAALVGSVDAAIQPALIASYKRLGVLARVDDDPATAGRPFDRDRSGFIVGEGAGALVLERWSHAKTRGAVPLAEWVGGIVLNDAAGLVRLDRSGETVAEAIRRLLKQTGISGDAIDAISLHGTGTIENDLGESAGCRAGLGNAVDAATGFSLKGAIGHLLGAAGSVEAVASVLALRDQVVPPTCNLFTPDPACRLHLSQSATPRPVRMVLKLSMGFGGHVVALLFRQWPA